MRYKQSYRQKQEQEQAARVAAGLISERFAGISSIEFHMTYYHRALDPVLMERTLRFFPSHYACFHMPCEQYGCTGGGYDLAPVVADLTRSAKTSARGTLYCHGSNGTVGHGSVAYEVKIKYACGARSSIRDRAEMLRRLAVDEHEKTAQGGSMSKKLYVGNLSYSTTEDDLREAFAKIGEVQSATLIIDQTNGRSKGFGFVEMASDDDAAKAITSLNGTSLFDRTITVNEARPKTERGGSGYGGGRGGDRGGYGGGRGRSWR